MTTIGDYKILPPQRLLIPKNDIANLVFNNEGEIIKLVVSYKETEGKEKKPKIQIEGKTDHAEITLTDWNSPFGSSTKEPMKVGTTDSGDGIYLMFSSSSTGDTKTLDMQVMLKGEKSEN